MKIPRSKFRLPAMLALVAGWFPLAGHAQEFTWAPDFPPGTAIIEIAAQDQDGNVRTFADLTGERGLLFMLSRSFDW